MDDERRCSTALSPIRGSIPNGPTNGRYKYTANEIDIGWDTSTSSGVVGYEVDREVVGVEQFPVALGKFENTGIRDTNSVALAHAGTATGVLYYVYAIGSDGVESPNDAVIYVSHIG